MKKVVNFIKYIVSSIDNHTDGASGRKLTAMWIIVIIITPADIYYTFFLKQQPDFITWLIIHFSVVLLLLGLVTFQQLLEFKTGKVTTETITAKKEEKIESIESVKTEKDILT